MIADAGLPRLRRADSTVFLERGDVVGSRSGVTGSVTVLAGLPLDAVAEANGAGEADGEGEPPPPPPPAESGTLEERAAGDDVPAGTG